MNDEKKEATTNPGTDKKPKVNTNAPEPPKTSYGIENIKEVVTLAATLGKGVQQAMEDGKWKFTDTVYFVPALKALEPAVKDFDLIDNEVGDLSEAEVEAIAAHVQGQLEDIDMGDDLRAYIQKAIAFAKDLATFIADSVEFFKKEE